MKNDLIKLANELKRRGLHKEAAYAFNLFKSAAGGVLDDEYDAGTFAKQQSQQSNKQTQYVTQQDLDRVESGLVQWVQSVLENYQPKS